MSDTLTLPLLEVHINRGKSVLSTYVPKHEVDVLKAVHGPDRVQVIGETDDEIELNANADAEWARLQRKYQRVNERDLVIVAYRMGPSGLKEHGFGMDRGRTEAAPQSGVRKHPKPAKADDKPDPKGKKAE